MHDYAAFYLGLDEMQQYAAFHLGLSVCKGTRLGVSGMQTKGCVVL